ncbi:TRAP transporter small permease [Cognatishimia sp. SS12]|uniref:TRAP transporter small permease n=1 Tax=Cognatishimia sp. SS12 TaxID=2979465 RepID=UPI00232E095A|nr:TRAP transporter small permease [Cognatishimia sp. SS12]MDC0738064.1 TRAP transporter small permease [Cognatishimia sp. SS12]
MFELLAIRIPKYLAALCLLAGIGINFANVIGRYVFSSPIFWAEEAMIFLVLWSVFPAFIAVTASRAHLKMDLLLDFLPETRRNLVERLGLIVGTVAMGYVTLQSWASIQKLWKFEMKSISLEIPMVIPHGAVVLGFGLSTVVAFLLIWRPFK